MPKEGPSWRVKGGEVCSEACEATSLNWFMSKVDDPFEWDLPDPTFVPAPRAERAF